MKCFNCAENQVQEEARLPDMTELGTVGAEAGRRAASGSWIPTSTLSQHCFMPGPAGWAGPSGSPWATGPEIDPHMLLPPSQSRLLSYLLLVLLFASFIHQAAQIFTCTQRDNFFILNAVIVIIIITSLYCNKALQNRLPCLT